MEEWEKKLRLVAAGNVADRNVVYLLRLLDESRALGQELAKALNYVAIGDEWVTTMYTSLLARAREAGWLEASRY